MLARGKTAGTEASGHMTEAEFKAFMDEIWGEEAHERVLEMTGFTVRNIPHEILLRLEMVAENREMTVEEFAREIICNAVPTSKSAKFIEITEKQFRENIDALMAAYDQEPIAIIDDKGQRFVLNPVEVYSLAEVPKFED
ncbi:hypothetical protein [Celeribacter persicus]|nr:hypothetical protein [Celeribacter persicus]